MTDPSPTPPPAAFGDPAVVRCERAAAELRAGRPVRIEDAEAATLAVLALDGSTPASRAGFLAAAGAGVELYLSAPRAVVLGLAAPHGALLAVTAGDDALLERLAWLPDPPLPARWRQADAGAADAAALA
ncbi:MAG: GTP cyclohydrolase, partial [Pseudoxanthomonas sp.]